MSGTLAVLSLVPREDRKWRWGGHPDVDCEEDEEEEANEQGGREGEGVEPYVMARNGMIHATCSVCHLRRPGSQSPGDSCILSPHEIRNQWGRLVPILLCCS